MPPVFLQLLEDAKPNLFEEIQTLSKQTPESSNKELESVLDPASKTTERPTRHSGSLEERLPQAQRTYAASAES
jgi:hypothetical protein